MHLLFASISVCKKRGKERVNANILITKKCTFEVFSAIFTNSY